MDRNLIKPDVFLIFPGKMAAKTVLGAGEEKYSSNTFLSEELSSSFGEGMFSFFLGGLYMIISREDEKSRGVVLAESMISLQG